MTKDKRKIAVITITYNDDYKFKEWCEHFNEYRDETDLHVIIDNGSSPEYLFKVKEFFKDSTIIERADNGGCTISYNQGIRYALNHSDVYYIVLIGNDMKLPAGGLTKLAETLATDSQLGMIEPIVLVKDSTSIDDFGSAIDSRLFMKEYMKGCDLSEVSEELHYADAVAGGMNMATRSFYEKVGLQDELLFMYSDEVDMGLRAKKCGLKLAAISTAKAWHQHINPNKNSDKRHPFSRYLIARNKTYLAKKHYGCKSCIREFFFFIKTSIAGIVKHIVKKDFSLIKDELWQMLGAYNGLINNMKPNKYSHL